MSFDDDSRTNPAEHHRRIADPRHGPPRRRTSCRRPGHHRPDPRGARFRAVDAAVAAARRPLGYTPSNGRPALREAARRAVARNAIYRERRDAGVAILAGSPALTVPVPAGAFSLFPRLTGPADDGATADRLLEAGVATVPGRAFGAPGHLRLSFATDLSTLQEGCRRILAALETRS